MAVTINGDGLIALGGTSSTQGRLRLAEDTDNGTNYIELTAPASVGSDRVITFPDATTTVVGTDTTQTLTNKTLGSGLVMGASAVTSATAQASTSGTSIDFTGIPSWVKRITVMFSGVSTNGSSNYLLQIGDSGGIEATGYSSASVLSGSAGTVSYGVATTGFIFGGTSGGNVVFGSMVLSLVGSNIWVSSLSGGVNASTAPYGMSGGGTKTLSDTLNQIRITTSNGTDTFDAGTINILYE